MQGDVARRRWVGRRPSMRCWAPTLWACTALVLALGALGAMPKKRTYDTHHYYVAEVRPAPCTDASELTPQHVAQALGAELVEQVGELRDHWLLRAEKPDEISRRSVLGEVPLHADPVLQRYASLSQRPHEKRCIGTACVPLDCLARSVQLERQSVRMRHKRNVIYDAAQMPHLYPSNVPPKPATAQWMREKRAPVPKNRTNDMAEAFHIKDPLFYKQWHLLNNNIPGHDLHISGAWKLASGKGVTVSLIDDGVDYTHPDLVDAFEARASYDFNLHQNLPLPRLVDDTHGTRCAGEIVAAKNDVCGVGVAPDAHVAGVRILSGPISDADEAAALNYGYQISDIYSCSWGPSDSGRSMDGPRGLVAKAMLNGIYHGRKGRGSLYVFAGGNGGSVDDQCNFDGYTNSIYTITIAAVDSEGHRPYYSEMCSAIIASAWSSGKGLSISTSNVQGLTNRTCTSTHGGTSAAAPLVAGALALALEVRPDLTWRDAQHLLIKSSEPINLEDPDWQKTAAGLMYSHKSGFGVVDATRLVENARSHKLVPPQAWLETPQYPVHAAVSQDRRVNHTVHVTRDMLQEANLASLEHVTTTVWITHERRGDVQVVLYGPHGTKSVLASPRRYDSDKHGFPGWTFMTLKHWGEDPVGAWTIEVSDHGSVDEDAPRNGTSLPPRGELASWRLTFWGAARNAKLAKPWNFPPDSDEYQITLPGAPTTTVLGSAPAHGMTFVATPTSSRHLAKPTHALPPDHDADPGETSHVFGMPSQTPEADSAFLASLAHASSSAWVGLAAVLIVVLLALLFAFLALRFRVMPWSRGLYAHVPDDEAVQLESMRHDTSSAAQAQSHDLYHAFALEDEDEDENQAPEAPDAPPYRDT